MTRPTWNEYFLEIAKAVSLRSDCERDKVGAVVVKDKRIRATGYNGAPAGRDGCATCPRRNSGCEPGSNYDNCVAVHAEANALLYCNREDLVDATIYLTRQPCYACTKLIEAAGVTKVIWPELLQAEQTPQRVLLGWPQMSWYEPDNQMPPYTTLEHFAPQRVDYCCGGGANPGGHEWNCSKLKLGNLSKDGDYYNRLESDGDY